MSSVSSSAFSNWFKNHSKLANDQQEIRIFNVDFRALSQVVALSTSKGLESNNRLNSCLLLAKKTRITLIDNLMPIRGKKILAFSQIGAIKKVLIYFAEALDLKIHGINPRDIVESPSYTNELFHRSFYETCLKFVHITTSQAILEAFANSKRRVHVIDFILNQGSQWPEFMQELALRHDGPPSFRLTGIDPPQPDNTDALQEVGWKLAQLAEIIGVEFEFRGFVAYSLADLDESMMYIRLSKVEAVVVNSVFELHRMLSKPGAIEKVLNLI
ncbi:hypothetical protein K7X08_016883 [Anisodus acutangulus]|uniref:Uncharacterized protein n=1 Tax=Anisodus acutangulus TaxID=402998 RepID=A0A9Q1R6N2_9SOLA|nr:hypothetical protein K7X08_016883 [Anisodus acutangulus]